MFSKFKLFQLKTSVQKVSIHCNWMSNLIEIVLPYKGIHLHALSYQKKKKIYMLCKVGLGFFCHFAEVLEKEFNKVFKYKYMVASANSNFWFLFLLLLGWIMWGNNLRDSHFMLSFAHKCILVPNWQTLIKEGKKSCLRSTWAQVSWSKSSSAFSQTKCPLQT